MNVSISSSMRQYMLNIVVYNLGLLRSTFPIITIAVITKVLSYCHNELVWHLIITLILTTQVLHVYRHRVRTLSMII